MGTTMLTVYVFTAVLGFGLVLLGALGGLHSGLMDGWDSDATIDFDHGGADFDHSIGGHDFDHDASADGSHEGIRDLAVQSTFWLPFFSIRFWIYAMAGFGSLGTIFSLLKILPAGPTLVWSLVFGALAGTIIASAMRWLKRSETDSSVRERDYVGVTGTLTVVPRNGEPGKVRMVIKGETIDMLALPDQKMVSQGVDMTKGEEVVVVGVDGTKVQVARLNDFMQD